MVGDQRRQRLRRCLTPFLGRVGINGRGIQRLAGRVDHGDLATGAKTGVDAHHCVFSQGRLVEQGAQILSEDTDGVGFRILAKHTTHIPLDGGEQQALRGVLRGQDQLFDQRGFLLRAEVVADRRAPIPLRRLHAHTERPLRLTAIDRQRLMGTQTADALLEIVVEFVSSTLVGGILDLFRLQNAPFERLLTDNPSHLGVIADGLGDNIAGAV